MSYFKSCCSVISEEEHSLTLDLMPSARPRAISSIHISGENLYQKISIQTMATNRESVLEPIEEIS